jgi:rifampicin phosphotransferase
MRLITAESATSTVATLAGTKGHNLRRLEEGGFSVPRWVALGVDVLDEVIEAAELTGALDKILADADPWNLGSVAERVHELFAATRATEFLDVHARQAHGLVGGGPVAVRSSGVEEDGGQFSFAGQFASYLNVRDSEGVRDRISDCWSSAYSERALHYRLRNGLPLVHTGIAVIVQEMIDAERSGVLFTADPVTGARDRCVVSAVYGLGEGLVSGAVDADTVVFDPTTGEIRESVVGEKRDRVVAAEGSGCDTRIVPAAERETLSLDAADLAALRAVAARAGEHFASPQDIEWAFSGDRLWLLQSRPITALNHADGEDRTSVDAEPVPEGEFRIWDNSNIIESFSGITSPLTFSFATDAYTRAYAGYAASLRLPREQLRQVEEWLPFMLGNFHGRIYYNLLHWYRMVRLAPVYPLNRRVLEVSLGVAESLSDELADSLHPYTCGSPWKRRLVRAVSTVEFTRRFLFVNRSIDRFARYFYRAYEKFDNVDYDSLSAAETYRRFRALERDLLDRWGPAMLLDASLLLSFGSLALLTRRWLPDAPQWFQWAVVNPGEDVESAEPARALRELAESVHADPRLAEIVENRAPEEVRQRVAELGYPVFLAAVDRYVARYGYRSPDELKLEVPDLRESPSALFPMLRESLPAPPASQGDLAQEYLNEHLRGPRRLLYEVVRRKTRNAATSRERLRFCRTRAFGSAKRMLRAIGRDLARNGVLDRWDLVFQLRMDELREVVAGAVSPADVSRLVTGRLRQRERDERLFAPARFTTHGSRYELDALLAAGWSEEGAASTGKRELRGIPSSPGVAEGPAVVTEDPRSFRGGVLFAYRTDPGWVPALTLASGLVIERGSPLTHVAIVARELGIPTVVQIDGATTEIRTGMRVRVDGSSGLVTVLEDDRADDLPVGSGAG